MTPDFLAQALGIPLSRAQIWAPVMEPALQLAEINTPLRVAAWLSQIGHESGRLRYSREIWGPTPAQARYEPQTKLSRTLGNVRPGDGRRYMGRGLIQVTGRANYASTSRRLRELVGESAPDVVQAPALLEVPEWAALSAAIYWRDRGLNRWADEGDVLTLTRRINGGTNGLADRQALYACATAAILQSNWNS